MSMNTEPHEIILDHLRAIRKEMKAQSEAIGELKSGQLSIREDVNSLRGDILRLERGVAAVEVDTDRIKARLDIIDPSVKGEG